jgi:hypothetical protein
MADQGVVVAGQGKEILPFGIRQNHAARHRRSICHKKTGDNRSRRLLCKTGYVTIYRLWRGQIEIVTQTDE